MQLISRSLGVAVITSVLLASSHGIAQTVPEVDWRLRPIRGVADQTADYAVFGPTNSIQLEVTFQNDERSPGVLVLDGGFFATARIVITDESRPPRAIPIRTTWDSELRCHGAGAPGNCSMNSRVALNVSNSATATATITPTVGEFHEGTYRVTVDFVGARSRLLLGDFSPWNGRIGDQGAIRLAVKPMQTVDDEKSARVVEGGLAMTRRDYGLALQHYQRLSTLDPSDVRGPAGMGSALLHLGRFSEAALSFERAMTLQQNMDSLVPQELAVAYVALGQEPRARTMLLQRRFSADTVEQIIVLARRRVAQLPKP